jgi:septal ring factor EnvC (AmiA/AmiB activator)
MRTARRAWIGGTLAVSLLALAEGSTAQTPPPSPAQPHAQDAAAEKRRREDALRSLEQTARANAESRGRLEREIAALKADQSRLATALVEAGRQVGEAEDRARATERRLDALLVEEAGLRRSLEGRHAVLGEVLGALQRLGHAPPPALLVRSGDLLAALRSAMMLGAVTPVLRDEAKRLVADLAELARLKSAIATDRAVLQAEYATLAAERDRIAALVQARQERLASVEQDARRERNRGERIGQEAQTLRDLILRMEREAAEATRREAEAKAEADETTRAQRQRIAEAERAEPARLAPRRAFAELRGSLARPASGTVMREFGAPDGSGGAMRGASIATRPRAVVTNPAEGTVVFAGPFRSYGRVLIINAGGGYYFLLAGMDAIQVEVGQFLLAGEPVARMGEVAAPAAALGVVEPDSPVLYVELRKDGTPIDPGPWWARSQSERARG